MNIIFRALGFICDKVHNLHSRYKTDCIWHKTGGVIQYPYLISGAENLEFGNNVNIGPNSTIYSTRAKLKIHGHFISGPGLTIITSDHHYIAGRYLDSVKDEEKEKYNDQDVLIEEDVWCGANVTILKGVTIGRSSIVAAGSVVTKDVPPYSIVGGVPAHVIRKKYSDADIEIHESFLSTDSTKESTK